MDPPLVHIFSWTIIHISSAYPRGSPPINQENRLGIQGDQFHCVPMGLGRSRTIFQLERKGVGLWIPDA